MQVAAPQIAVQARGRLGRPAQRLQLREQALEVAPHARRRQPGVDGGLQLRAEAPHPVELGPGERRCVFFWGSRPM